MRSQGRKGADVASGAQSEHGRAAEPGTCHVAERVTTVEQPLKRRVRLKDEDWARISWRAPGKMQRPATRPFDIDACVRQAEAICPYGRLRPEQVRTGIPSSLSKEEAWFWLHCLDVRSCRQGLHSVRANQPSDEQIRAWAAEVAQRPDFLYYDVPQTLLPFFTPAEIADLIVRRFELDVSGRPSVGRFAAMTGFAAFVAPWLDADERSTLRDTLGRAFDALDLATATAHLVLALLATVGGGQRLATYIAGLPDGAWARDWSRGGRPIGHLEVLTGLGDEASFVREAARLGVRPRLASDRRLWLAVTEWRELDVLKDQAIAASAKDDAAAVVRLLALVEAPEAALPMLEVQLGSKAPALAAEWFGAHPLHAAIGLTPVAMGVGKLAEAAHERLRTLKMGGHTPLLAARQHLTPEQGAWLQREILDVHEESLAEASVEDLPDALRMALEPVKAAKLPSWLSLPALPPIILQGLGKRLGAAEVGKVLAALAEKPVGASTGSRAALLGIVKAHTDAIALDAFAWKLFELWRGMGCDAKGRWALWAVGRLGGDGCVLKLTPLLRAWPGESQHGRAVFGLACLREIGSDSALMALNGIAQKLKFKGLKAKAQEMMQGIAEARGFTAEQLADRIVPDCGLDARGSRVFDFGPRQFRFVLGPAMKPLVRDAEGKLRTDLPAPAKSDDAGKAAAAVAEWKLLKKTLREVLKVQVERLEDAMISGRRWTPAELQTLFVEHPLMVNLVRQLVLAVYDDAGRVSRTFRVTEDQTFADQHDEDTSLPSSGQIGVVHPAHLDETLTSAWGQVLGDYEIIPPFTQLGRDICRPESQELDGTEITRFRGPKIQGIVLYGMLERNHWLRDMPADGGGFMQHSRHFPAAKLTAFIRYTPGLSIGWYEQPQELDAIYFVPGHIKPTYWGRHEHLVRIKDVDPVVLSEVLRLAHALAAKAA
jgi:hypothetical protein